MDGGRIEGSISSGSASGRQARVLGTSFLMRRVSQPTDVCGEKYFEERRGKVIDALYVPAGRMSYRPDVQYTF